MTDRFTPALNKVPGYWLKGITALANKPPALQIFAPSKFGIYQSTGLKVIAKNFICAQFNFLVITLEPVAQFIPDFEGAKICKVGVLFAKAIVPLSQ